MIETQPPSSLASTPETRSDDGISGVSTIAYGFMASQACNPNLSKVGAAARNARCEADNFNSDKPEGSHRGAVYSHISKSAFAPSTDILQCVFNVRNVPQPDSCTQLRLARAMNACRLIQLRRWRLPTIPGESRARAIWQSLD